MHGRLPYLAAKQKEPRVLVRMAKHQREAIVLRIVRVLSRWESSKFEYEGACRNGLRSALCLTGQSWAAADKFAREVVDEALHKIGAVRPTWIQGQPEWQQDGYVSPIEFYYCVRCGNPIPPATNPNRYSKKYCSILCKNAAVAQRARDTGRKAARAEYLAACAARSAETREMRAKPCENCGTIFTPDRRRETHSQGEKRFCSIACAAYASASKRARPQKAKACECCGKLFTKRCQAMTNAARYCSRGCSNTARPPKPNGFACEPAAAE